MTAVVADVLADDAELMARQARFLRDVERTIRAANQTIIHERVPSLDGETVTRLAVAVAKLRARYLEAALGLIDHAEGVAPDQADIGAVTKARVMYEEAMHAFEAMRRAIERGYVDLSPRTS